MVLGFFYRQRRTFWTADGRFLNRDGCCRHAKHSVGGIGDDKEENSFPVRRHQQLQQGEAANNHNGFLCLSHPLIDVANREQMARDFSLKQFPRERSTMPYGRPQAAVFHRQRRTFWTADGRFLNRDGCWRHAMHDISDDGDDKNENLFSDWRHHQPQ